MRAAYASECCRTSPAALALACATQAAGVISHCDLHGVRGVRPASDRDYLVDPRIVNGERVADL